jgi:hypothetical protein
VTKLGRLGKYLRHVWVVCEPCGKCVANRRKHERNQKPLKLPYNLRLDRLGIDAGCRGYHMLPNMKRPLLRSLSPYLVLDSDVNKIPKAQAGI